MYKLPVWAAYIKTTLPSITTLGRDQIHVENHVVRNKGDKRVSKRRSKASRKRKKKAHKRGPFLFSKNLMGYPQNNLHIDDLFEPLEGQTRDLSSNETLIKDLEYYV